MIDLRSDTLTQPTKEMLAFMMAAKVGDDVFNEDPTVNQLEQDMASMFGMEAAIFCPSGTMTNQIAIKVHSRPGDEIICDEFAHVYRYEGGGIALNSGASVRLVPGDRGRITATQIEIDINPDNVHFPKSSLVCLENTSNKGGGSCYSLNEIKRIKEVCKTHNLKLHLDGARLFNALVAKNEKPQDYGQIFDSISICLSKGLGAPIGSILLGTKDFIKQSRRVRKVFGGGMRQAGYLAAAGIYALNNNIDRLAEDHKKARILADEISKLSNVVNVMPVETNIIIYEINSNINENEYLKILENKGIKAVGFGPNLIRLVTHLDFTDQMLEKSITIFRSTT